MNAPSQVIQTQDVELQAIHAALNRVQAVIEFDLEGIILHANENFLRVLGYSLSEVQGRHHSMFCEPEFAASPAYKQFWIRLAAGEYEHGEYKRVAKDGRGSGSTPPTIP
jgi:methyl-accepting chemotaxis protein